jgi:choline dehydrogenase-like flavoprotein
MLDFGLDRAAEILRDAGAGETLRMDLVPDSGFHIMGTARMGSDPARSVADPLGRCHDVPNLWIADASLFPTASALQPTLTALALAERAAASLLGG